MDPEKVATGATVTDEFAETLPTTRIPVELSHLVPGVTGGHNMNVLGGTQYGNQYLLDGFDITDPVTNTVTANVDFDSIRAVEVMTGGRDAEYGSAAGGVVNLASKSGGNDFHADVSIYYQPDALQWRDEEEEGRRKSALEIAAGASGPLLSDRLWYAVSLAAPYTTLGMAEPEGGWRFPDQGSYPPRTFVGLFALGKLTFRFSGKQTFELLVQADPARVSNTRQSPVVHPDAEARQDQGGLLIAARSETRLSERLTWLTRAALSRILLDIGPASCDEETPARFNQDTGLYTRNYDRLFDEDRLRVQVHSKASLLVDLLGRHRLESGVDVSLTWSDVFETRPGELLYVDTGVTDPSDPLSEPLPDYRVEVVEPEETSVFGDHEAVFVQDVWKPIPSLTLRPGVRFDSTRLRNWDGVTQVETNTFSPRIGLAWDPFGDGKTVIRGGYWQYVDTGCLALSQFAGGKSKAERLWYYNVVTEQYDSFGGERGGANGAVAWGYLRDPWDQQRPRTHEIIVGFDREVAAGLAVSGSFVYRRHVNQWEDNEINLMWNRDGTEVIGYRDGQERWRFGLGALEEAHIRYVGLDLVLSRRMSETWGLLASYTYSRTQGTEPGVMTLAFDNPTQEEYEYGDLPHDRRHVLKIAAAAHLPLGLVLGTQIRYQTGAPYNRWALNSFYGEYYNRYAPRGEDWDPETLTPTGEKLRLPDLFWIDTRVTWQLEELTGQRIDAIVDVFNLLNRRTPTAVETRNLDDASFGQTTAKLDPLSVQVGLRYRY